MARLTHRWLFLIACLALCSFAIPFRPTLAKGQPTTQPAAPTTQAAVEPADNSYCFVCHANFKKEDLAAKHQPVGVGCATCHGESDRHSSDENGITPPEVMFAKDRINVSCMGKCHPAEKLDKANEHKPILAGKPTDRGLCTD